MVQFLSEKPFKHALCEQENKSDVFFNRLANKQDLPMYTEQNELKIDILQSESFLATGAFIKDISNLLEILHCRRNSFLNFQWELFLNKNICFNRE